MTEKRYTGNSLEDLLHDEEFVSDIKKINNRDEWEQFLQAHNETRKDIIQAKEFIELFQTSEEIVDEERKQKLWNSIYRFDVENSDKGNHRLIHFKTFFRIAAAILIIISLGSVTYLHFNKVKNQYQFFASENDFKGNEPLLVLSNGTKIGLEKSESKITVLKDQESIQINNDSIVRDQSSSDKNGVKIKFNQVIIPYGKKSKLVLADGTTVWLNAGSRFAFPSKFIEKNREVFLDGEAYFEVTKVTNCPFIVKTGEVNIEVLGTKFNINAYNSDNESEAVLLEGSINIWDNSNFIKEKILMAPYQRATYSKTFKKIELRPEPEPEKTIAWVGGWYQFANVNLEVVLKKVEKYYNVKFEYDQLEISKSLPVSGKLDLKESLGDVLVILSNVAKFQYKISGNVIIIKNSENKDHMKN